MRVRSPFASLALACLALGALTLGGCRSETPAPSPPDSLAAVPGAPSDAGSADSAAAISGTYGARLPAATSPGRDVRLTLAPGGEARFSVDYLNGEPPVAEAGTWARDELGLVVLTLGGRRAQMLLRPHADSLTAVAYDVDEYGSQGLPLTRLR